MAEVRLTQGVKATRVVDIDALLKESAVPGSFCFGTRGGKSLTFVCPCGCGSLSDICIHPQSEPKSGNGPSWQWDGNEDKPTLIPSIYQIGHWHGFLQRGIWVQA